MYEKNGWTMEKRMMSSFDYDKLATLHWDNEVLRKDENECKN